MKNFFLFFFLFLFSFSCSELIRKTEDGSGVVDDDNEDTDGEVVDLVEDKDCATLSAELPDDVIAKFELAALKESTRSPFLIEAEALLKENIPNFIHHHVVEWKQEKNIVGFEFSYRGAPLCSSYAKIYKTRTRLVLTGNAPSKEISEQSFLHEIIPTPLQLSAVQSNLGSLDVTIEKEKLLCYAVKDDKLVPVWKQKVKKRDEPYLVLADGETIFSLQPLFFHSKGTLKTYDESKDDGVKLSTFKRYQVDKMSKGGTLCSARFQIAPEDGQPKAQKDNLKFLYDPETELALFEQASMFAYAHIHSEYIANLEYTKKWYGPQILLIPDMRSGGITNAAQYIPGDSLARPEIRIPNGDNTKLYQIRVDNEAIQHEVGHHVLFRAVTIPQGESLVIHEGIADSFVELRTENACLGEHLCLNDLLCVSSSCLRTAENDYRVDSSNLPAEAHSQSQLISGLLWDFALEIGYKKTAAILNYAIDLLPRKAYFADLIIALYNTLDILYSVKDEETFNSYCNSLLEVYEKRGFGPLAAANDLVCHNE